MRVAYADPPYIGQAKRHYSDQPLCAEVDHAELIERLNTFDAWALSLSSPTLKQILNLCPDDVRVGAWVKPWAVWKDRNCAHAWEPVIFRGGRKRSRKERTVRDWVSANAVMRGRGGLKGTKPDEFSWWVFDFLGMEPEDEFHDLFPGSGAVTRAWDLWRRAHSALPLWSEHASTNHHESLENSAKNSAKPESTSVE